MTDIAENKNVPFTHSSSEEDDFVDFGEFFGTIIDNKWFIILVTLIFFSLGLVKTVLDTPVYKADALLQVNDQAHTLAELDPFTGAFENKIPIITEIGIIQSRMILGKAVENLDLHIIAKPKYFSVIGEAIARYFQQRNQRSAISQPLFGLHHYAWGGEAIQVESLTMPVDWENQELTLVAGTQGRFQLFYDDELILEGEVGKLASKQVGDDQNTVSIFVSLLRSRPETQFSIIRQSRGKAIKRLKGILVIKENGDKSGLLELALESPSPASAVRIINEIANIYVQQNVDHKSAESQKTLAFLEKQLPILKEQLEAANNILNEYKNQHGSVDLDVETKNVLESIVEIKTQETLLRQNRDELRQKYTDAHPAIVAVDKQIARLQEQMRAHEAMVKKLPKTQQVILELSSEVEIKANLYTTLLNKAQTLRVAKEGAVGDVRIIDYAELPEAPIKPKKLQIIGLASGLGLFLGIVAVFIRKSMHHGVKDPDLIEKQLHIPVYATVPHSKSEEKLDSKYHKRNTKTALKQLTILALEEKEDIAVESLRSLRTTMHFALLEAQNNIIVITGPSAGIGKTFVSINLATVTADAGKKVLLIDGDLRKGRVNKRLGINRENGLSEIILSNITAKEAVYAIPQANFDFIASGILPPNPSELLLHENFANFLARISQKYDLVIIDTPPILAVTDAAIIARMASAVFMVAKAGEHTMRELEQSAKKFFNAGAPVKGIIVNDVPLSTSRYGYGKYVYQYSYGKSAH